MGSEVIVVPAIFLGMPWIIMHYLTKWKQAPKITQEDENLLDDMYNLARRLEERMITVERIVAADNPDFKPGLNAPQTQWQQSSPIGPNYSTDRRN
jgi:phage shock protein B